MTDISRAVIMCAVWLLAIFFKRIAAGNVVRWIGAAWFAALLIWDLLWPIQLFVPREMGIPLRFAAYGITLAIWFFCWDRKAEPE
jgi:hypothetical protein